MIVLNRDHDESFLRSNVDRIRDKKSLVPLGVVGVEDGRTESAWVLWEHVAELCPAGLHKDLGFDGVGVGDVERLTYL